jgi:hypothetical protein
MTAAPGAEQLAIARAEVNRACGLLIAPTPEALQNCQQALTSAVSALTEFREQCRQTPTATSASLATRALRNEIHRAGRLLQNLANFYRGWERILGTMSGGYTANGDPAPVSRAGRQSCQG